MFCANAAAYDYKLYTPEEMKKMNTRHLLAILRKTYTWGCCDACWECLTTKKFKCCYQQQLKEELATREHIPNRQEGKALRRLRQKRGYK